jgi:hypothetical protein
MRIKVTDDGFIIDGSLRKWYLGAETMNDLTRKELGKACKELSKCLGIELDYILDARILIIEIGMNFNIGMECSAIIDRIYEYSSLKKFCVDDETVEFRGKTGVALKFYDKIKEMTGKKNISSTTLRIEIRCTKFAATKSKLRGAMTLLDIIYNYRMIIVSFLNEIKRIQMTSILIGIDDVDFSDQTVTDVKKWVLAMMAHQIGLRKLIGLYKRTRTSSSGISRHKKELVRLSKKYSQAGVYQKSDLMKIIKKQLAREISQSGDSTL